MIRTIASFEFFGTLKSKLFVLVTFGIPLVLLGSAFLFGIIFGLSDSNLIDEVNKPLAVVDESGILSLPESPLHNLTEGEPYNYEPRNLEILERRINAGHDVDIARYQRTVVCFKSLEKARQALESEEVRSIVVVSHDYLRSADISRYRAGGFITGIGGIHPIEALIVETLLKRSSLPPEYLKRIQEGSFVSDYEIAEDGTITAISNQLFKEVPGGLALGISLIMIMALLINTGMLVSSVVIEKESRIIEILLSSIKAQELLLGKVIGIISAGLLQMFVWLLFMGAIPFLSFFLFQESLSFDLEIYQLVVAVVFGILGLVFYGVLFAGLGSLGNSERDARHLSTVALLFASLPLVLVLLFITQPDGILAKALSFIPLFSPSAMILRVSQTVVPFWEVAVAFFILLVSIWLALKFANRCFKAGMLIYGQEISFRRYFKILRGGAS